MNIISDEEMALDSGDLCICKHCGARYWVDDWHICHQGQAAAKAETEAWERRYIGTGKKVRRQLLLTIESYDTEGAFTTALSDFEMYYPLGDMSNDDAILGFKWSVKEIK